jgi:hypothetical protein
MKEFIIPNKVSLTKSISRLNKIFIVLHQLPAEKFKSWLTMFLKETKRSPELGWKCLLDLETSFNQLDNTNKDISHPVTLFTDYSISPFIGNKEGNILYCKDWVIGLVDQTHQGTKISYRLDYDPNKGLHINVELSNGDEKFPFCLLCQFSHGPFGFSHQFKKDYQDSDEKLKNLLEITKVKFWLKMTLGYILSRLEQQQVTDEQDSFLKHRRSIYQFISGQAHQDMTGLKNSLICLVTQQETIDAIEKCNDEVELLTAMNKNMNVRHEFYPLLLNQFANHHASERLRSTYHQVNFHDTSDSEHRASSPSSPQNLDQAETPSFFKTNAQGKNKKESAKPHAKKPGHPK